MTPEEYKEYLESLKDEHDALLQDMGGREGQGQEEGATDTEIPEPEPVAPAEVQNPDAGQIGDERANEIPEPPAGHTFAPPQGQPEVPESEQRVEIPEPPPELPQDIDAFLHEQKSQWQQAQNRQRPKPPDFDMEEDSGMSRVGNIRHDLDDFATNMQSSYESVQQAFGVLSDITSSHGRNVSDILARLMRARLP